LPSDVRLFCYSKEEDASLGQNSLENHYTSVSKHFFRAENDEGCYGTGQFDIIVEPIPKSKLLKKEFSGIGPFHHFGIGHLVSGANG
jgi:hypothetical protein